MSCHVMSCHGLTFRRSCMLFSRLPRRDATVQVWRCVWRCGSGRSAISAGVVKLGRGKLGLNKLGSSKVGRSVSAAENNIKIKVRDR